MATFDEVWAQHGASLQRVAASYLGPGPEREDLEQEIAVAVHRALDRFRGDSSLRTYLFRIAHNCGLKRITRARPRGELLDEAEHPGGSLDPETVASARQAAEHLAAALRALPLGQRQVLTLALEQLPIKEIAEVLGLSENATNVRLHRARNALRERLARPRPDRRPHE